MGNSAMRRRLPFAIACLFLVALAAARPEVPTRGMSMATVEKLYGEPLEKRDPVGDPPITRWVYADFVVFFEYDKVIHSVVTTEGTSTPGS